MNSKSAKIFGIGTKCGFKPYADYFCKAKPISGEKPRRNVDTFAIFTDFTT